MNDEQVKAAWQQISIQLLHEVACKVNLPQQIGTDRETGVALMFFNKQNHNGRATFLSTLDDPEGIKKILKYTLQEFNRHTIVEPTKRQ